MAKVGDLLINLRASTAGLATDLKRASDLSFRTSKEIQRSFKFMAAAIATAAVGATAAMAVAVQKAANQADQYAKLARQVGVSVESLSALTHAASLSGVGLEELTGGIKRLAANMRASVESPTSEAALAFTALGVKVTDSQGALRDFDALLPEVADRFASMKDGSEKTALAMALFGKSGATLIPLLNSGSSGIKQMTDEAKKLGLVISTDTAAASERWNDNLERLKGEMQGAVNTILAGVIPSLADMSDKLVAAARDSSFLADVATTLSATLRVLTTAGTIIATVFKVLGTVVRASAAATLLVARGEFNAAFEVVKGGAVDMQLEVGNAVQSVAETWDSAAKKAAASGKVLNEGITLGLERLKQQADAAKLAAKESTEQLKAALEAYKPLLEGENAPVVAVEVDSSVNTATEKLKELGEAYKEIGRKLEQELRTPMEKFNDTIAELNVLYDQGAISVETYARALERASDELDKADEKSKTAGRAMMDFRQAIGNAFEDAIVNGRKLSDVFKALLQDIIRLIIRMTIMKALFGEDGEGGLFGSLFGKIFGGKAHGGGMSARRPFVVGERGPEVFVPDSAGTMIPNNKLGGGGDTYIDARGADAGVEHRVMRAIAAAKKEAVAEAVATMRELRLRTV